MYNMLLNGCPEYYRDYKINTDYRVGIKISQVLDDYKLEDEDRALNALSLLYGAGIPDDVNIALDGLRWFLSCGKECNTEEYSNIEDVDNTKKKEVVHGEDIAYDFDIDAGAIYSAFMKCYNIDLCSIDYLHWFKFIYLMGNLKNTSLNDIMYYRTLDLDQYKDAKTRSDMRKIKEQYKINKLTSQKVADLKVIYGSDWVKHI